MVREWTGHLPLYAEAKKMKLLTLHTHGCARVSLRDGSSFPLLCVLHSCCDLIPEWT